VLVQNPPCVPLLLVLALLKATRLNRSRVIIDWHNYGYSIMRVGGVNRSLVFLAKVYEMQMAKWADSHLCVSKAMQTDLVNKFGIRNPPKVLYDKAIAKFRQSLTLGEMHELFKRAGLVNEGSEGCEKTIFTEIDPTTKKA
jgi:beta-1,4-mannosyltransferase